MTIQGQNYDLHPPSYFPDGHPVPDLMTISELIELLRIPEVSTASNHHNVIKNLIRMRDLPRIQICNKLLFPKKAILQWIEDETFPKTSLTDKAHADICTVPLKRPNIKVIGKR